MLSPSWGHRAWRASAIAVVAGAALAIAACGSDEKTEGTPAQSAKKPTGAPVKIMVVSAVDTPIQDYPDVWAAGKAAANAINDAGGINGQPIEILTCNDKSDPNGATACAREAVSKKVAVVTGTSIGTAAMLPVLESAGLQWVGGFAQQQIDCTAANAWPLTLGSRVFPAVPIALAKQGKKKVGGAVTGVAAAEQNIEQWQRGADAVGVQLSQPVVKMPIEATDFAPFVQQLKNQKIDSATAGASSTQIIQLMKTAEQLGLKVLWGQQAGSVNSKLLQDLGSAGEGLLVIGPLPAIDADVPVSKRFNSEMDAAEKAGVSDTENRRTPTENTWLALHAIAALGQRIDGTIDAASITKTLQSEKDIDV
ncbi:MAG: ABC transporter substrate-binding protein, partial [Burkholderiales bacterium]